MFLLLSAMPLGTVRTLVRKTCSTPGVVRIPFGSPHIVKGDSPSYRSCAVVGSSGALLHHTYGSDISSAQAVFRANNPPTEGYEQHVGNRTDVHVLNTLWYPRLSHGRGSCSGMTSSRPTPSSGGVLLERETCMGGDVSVGQLEMGFNATFIGHFNNVVNVGWRWWDSYHPGTHFTTGMAMISIAISMCDHVRIYGFSDEPARTYHYYDSRLAGLVHNFGAEHALYDEMQERGVAIMCGYEDPLAPMSVAWYMEKVVNTVWYGLRSVLDFD